MFVVDENQIAELVDELVETQIHLRWRIASNRYTREIHLLS